MRKEEGNGSLDGTGLAHVVSHENPDLSAAIFDVDIFSNQIGIPLFPYNGVLESAGEQRLEIIEQKIRGEHSTCVMIKDALNSCVAHAT